MQEISTASKTTDGPRVSSHGDDTAGQYDKGETSQIVERRLRQILEGDYLAEDSAIEPNLTLGGMLRPSC